MVEVKEDYNTARKRILDAIKEIVSKHYEIKMDSYSSRISCYKSDKGVWIFKKRTYFGDVVEKTSPFDDENRVSIEGKYQDFKELAEELEANGFIVTVWE